MTSQYGYMIIQTY